MNSQHPVIKAIQLYRIGAASQYRLPRFRYNHFAVTHIGGRSNGIPRHGTPSMRSQRRIWKKHWLRSHAFKLRIVATPVATKLQRILSAQSNRFPELFNAAFEEGAGPTVRFLSDLFFIGEDILAHAGPNPWFGKQHSSLLEKIRLEPRADGSLWAAYEMQPAVLVRGCRCAFGHTGYRLLRPE